MIRYIAMAMVLMLGPCTLCKPAYCQTVPHPQIQKDGNTLKPYAVVFSAKWCGPCQQMKPHIESLRKRGYLIYVVDVDLAPQSKEKMGVSSLPTIILMNGGAEQDRHVGGMQLDELRQYVDSNDNAKPDNSSPDVDDNDPGIPLPTKPKDYKLI